MGPAALRCCDTATQPIGVAARHFQETPTGHTLSWAAWLEGTAASYAPKQTTRTLTEAPGNMPRPGSRRRFGRGARPATRLRRALRPTRDCISSC